MPRVYIGVGSNIAPESNIPEALRRLSEKVHIRAISTFYRTPAIGSAGSPDFVDGVVAADTDIAPRELKFGVLRAIEAALGRERTADRNAPRVIDLDLLLYGDRVIREPDLVVPDPDLTKRAFLALPALELDPNLMVPGTQARLSDAAALLDSSAMVPLRQFTAQLRQEIEREP